MNTLYPVNCKDVMSHICESLGEELQSERCKAIRAHLDECRSCQQYFSSVEQTIGFYRKYEINLPEDAHGRLMKSLGLED
jgi:predicted anti-sigma-YlaC factor YlaD